MNLLKDPWIPVRKGTEFPQITYKELLCSEQPELQVALPRDDLELACIQMLAAMTQVIFMPDSTRELRERVKTPLVEDEYDKGVENFIDWFDLDHPDWPFMQVKGVNGEWTSIQKLMIGMPEITSKSGSAHAFFNEPAEISAVCPGIAAIALFNQASNSPSFGGGFKGSLRGAGPVSTMILGSNLRNTVWKNILTIDNVRKLLPWYNESVNDDKPVWVDSIPENGVIVPNSIGLLRGLFWQPADIELLRTTKSISCDVICGIEQECYIGFKKCRHKFELNGTWPHPYSPRQFESDGTVKYLAFKGENPAWTQMSECLFDTFIKDYGGFTPAAIIAQNNDMGINLLIGGYKVEKGAKIVYRRHDIYSIPAGWSDDFRDKINTIVEIGLEAEKLLTNKVLYPLIKGDKKKNIKAIGVTINSKASTYFFHLTEPLIHRILRETSLREFIRTRNEFITELSRICLKIFELVTRPYSIKPDLIGPIAIAREKLQRLLNELSNRHKVTGGAA